MKRFLFLIIALNILGMAFLQAAAYDTMLQKMNQLVNANPNYVQLIDIGRNDDNVVIYGLKIENPSYDDLTIEGNKTPQLLVGCHHGNEQLSADVCIVFTQKVVAKLKDPNCPEYAALSRCIFYVIPVLNINGYNANRRTEKNQYGYLDPNRDYPDPCAQNKYFQLASVKNLSIFVERYNIVGAVTAHGYIGTFTFPWGIYTKNTHTADHNFYVSIAQQSVKYNGYQIGTHTDVIYPAVGSFEDWCYHKFGVWTMLLEHKSNADLNKDADCLVKYFSLVPTARSTQHTHNPSNCTAARLDGPSRP